jgi:hypothetical protein
MPEEKSRRHPVREDMRFQYAFWIAERVAWTMLALVPVVALSGIFAHGVLSERIAGGTDAPLRVEYERFQRQSALSHFVARIAPAGAPEVTLRLSPAFQRAFEVESIQPQPLRSSAGSQGLELVFHAPPAGDLVAAIWARPREFGFLRLKAESGGGGAVDFPVLIYP